MRSIRNSYNKKSRYHTLGAFQGKNALVRLRGGQPSNEANFKRILPSAMKELVARGLFEPWEGTYRITEKGRSLLKELDP